MMDDFNQFMINILTEYGDGIAKAVLTIYALPLIYSIFFGWRKAKKRAKEAPDQYRLF